jgi:hypothetical protein
LTTLPSRLPSNVPYRESAGTFRLVKPVVRDRIELSTFRFSGRKTSRRIRLWPESSLTDVRRVDEIRTKLAATASTTPLPASQAIAIDWVAELDSFLTGGIVQR